MQPKLVSAQHIAQTGLEHRILLCPTAKFISVHCHAWRNSALLRIENQKIVLMPLFRNKQQTSRKPAR